MDQITDHRTPFFLQEKCFLRSLQQAKEPRVPDILTRSALLGELTENIGLPLELLEKPDPWPACVTYTSPMVRRLIEKSKARELEYTQTLEESRWTHRQSRTPSIVQLKRKRSSKTSGKMVLKDMKSETMLSVWSDFSASAAGPTITPETIPFHMDSRESPTANFNKIIFSQKPLMRMLPSAHFWPSRRNI
ncbi:CMT1A duplicated region transcript 4 protein [Myotis yumanensis]|uniref:CMT1A duplicated region transcript 4 protein n=1 Tax=Myotis yumanensis TaxID=159337 RepID=UPI0038D49673